MKCAHCNKHMAIRIIVQERCACWDCHLLHDPKSGEPVGWLIEVAGKSGGLIPFEQIRALAGSNRTPECVATIFRIAATMGLSDPSLIKAQLDFEAALAREEIRIH